MPTYDQHVISTLASESLCAVCVHECLMCVRECVVCVHECLMCVRECVVCVHVCNLCACVWRMCSVCMCEWFMCVPKAPCSAQL